MSPAFLPGNYLSRNSGLSFQEACNFFNSFMYEISSILSAKHWTKSLSGLMISLKYPCLFPSFFLNHDRYHDTGLYRVQWLFVFLQFFSVWTKANSGQARSKDMLLETDNPWSSSSTLSILRWFYPGLNYFDNLKSPILTPKARYRKEAYSWQCDYL